MHFSQNKSVIVIRSHPIIDIEPRLASKFGTQEHKQHVPGTFDLLVFKVILGSTGGWGGGRIWLKVSFQPLKIIHTNCRLDSVVHVGVCVVLFGPNNLRPIFGCQDTDSIPPQASRKESLRPLY